MVASDDDDAFLSQFQQLLRRLNERPDDRPGTLTPLGERLQEHLGADPRHLPVVVEQVPPHRLIDLDLAYSPVYGSAKDPVNMIGMVGANVIDGVLQLWYAEEWESLCDSALILDVRSKAEFAAGHLPGALHVPHTELRGRIEEVRAAAEGRPVRALCGSGVRSHIANRVLSQAGFDSASLSGGMLTLRAVLGEGILVTG